MIAARAIGRKEKLMKPVTRLAAVICLGGFLLPAGFATEPRVDRIEIQGAGIYTTVRAAKQEVDNLPGGGLNIIKDTQLVKAIDTIPLKLGTTFGISYTVIGEPAGAPVELTISTIFPKEGVRDPKQKKTYYQSDYKVRKIIGKQTFKSYSLEEEWELVPGDWVFEIRLGDRVLARQKFKVAKEE